MLHIHFQCTCNIEKLIHHNKILQDIVNYKVKYLYILSRTLMQSLAVSKLS